MAAFLIYHLAMVFVIVCLVLGESRLFHSFFVDFILLGLLVMFTIVSIVEFFVDWKEKNLGTNFLLLFF